MLELLTDLMNDAEGRCAYAEARHVDVRSEAIAVLNGRIDAIDSSASEGIGVRVQVGGGWGFAATRDVTRAGAQAALARALAVAESQPATAARPLAPVAPALGHWASPYELDPFAVALEDKLELLFAVEARAAHRRRAPRAHGRHLPRVARAQGLRLDRGRGLHAGDAWPPARASPPTPPTAATCRCAPTRPPTAAA